MASPPLAMLMDMDIDIPSSRSHVIIYFHATSSTLTALFMIGSEIIARFSCHSQPVSTNPSPIIINAIPFSTLNISIALTIVVNIILTILSLNVVNGIQLSVVLVALFVTNKKARQHLRIRLRQNLDSLTVGSSSKVAPVVSVALVPIRDFQWIQ